MQAPPWLCILACAALTACEPPPPKQLLDHKELQLQVRSLAAVAAQGQMFTQQVASGSVSGEFAWVQQQALSDEVSKAAQVLARPTSDDLRASHQRALALAQQLQERINRVASARDQAAALNGLDHDFGALASEAQRLRESS